MLVIIMHFYEQTSLNEWWVFRYIGIGQVGVVVFFLISGFVIPFSIKNKPEQLAPFLVSRFFRLYPAFWVSVILALVSKELIFNETISIGVFLANLTMVPGVFGKPMLYSVYWTLLVELAFYLMCIIMYLTGVIYNYRVKAFVAILLLFVSLSSAAARYLWGVPSPVGVISAISLMMFSGLWRGYVIEHSHGCKDYSLIYLLIFTITYPITSYLSYGGGRTYEGYPYYIVNYLCGVALFLLFTTKFKINNYFFVSFGLISYSAYLTHPFVLDLFIKFHSIHGAFDIGKLTEYLIASLVFAFVLYRYVEKPSHSIGGKLKRGAINKKLRRGGTRRS